MHVVVNAATSVDGKLSTPRRQQVAISGPEDFARVDRLRAEVDAVMVGAGTVNADDPSLTVDDPDRRRAREERGDAPNPARVVADSRARIPLDARVLDDRAHTYLLVAEDAPDDRLEELRARSTVTVIVAGDDRVDLPAALEALEREGVAELLVEGGGEVLFSLFAADLVDELSVFVGSIVVGGRDAPTLVDGEGFVDPAEFPALDLQSLERVDNGALLRYAVV